MHPLWPYLMFWLYIHTDTDTHTHRHTDTQTHTHTYVVDIHKCICVFVISYVICLGHVWPCYPLLSCYWFSWRPPCSFRASAWLLAGTPSGRLAPWTAPGMDGCISLSFWVPWSLPGESRTKAAISGVGMRWESVGLDGTELALAGDHDQLMKMGTNDARFE